MKALHDVGKALHRALDAELEKIEAELSGLHVKSAAYIGLLQQVMETAGGLLKAGLHDMIAAALRDDIIVTPTISTSVPAYPQIMGRAKRPKSLITFGDLEKFVAAAHEAGYRNAKVVKDDMGNPISIDIGQPDDQTMPEIDGREETVADWTEWSTGECPVELDSRVDVKMRNGTVLENIPACWVIWQSSFAANLPIDIIAYRRHQPEPASTLADELHTQPPTAEATGPVDDVPAYAVKLEIDGFIHTHPTRKLLRNLKALAEDREKAAAQSKIPSSMQGVQAAIDRRKEATTHMVQALRMAHEALARTTIGQGCDAAYFAVAEALELAEAEGLA